MSMSKERGEQMYWSRLNQAVSAFCLENALDGCNEDKMICSLVGEELEWCGSHSYLFMASRYMQATSRIAELERRRQLAELSLNKEIANTAGLRKSLKQLQVSAEDTEWQFQEQLAHTKHLVELEQSTSGDLRGTVQSLQRRLAEMEARMNSATAGVREQGPAALLAEAERREEDARLRLVEREIEELDEEFTEALAPPPRLAGGKMLFAASQPNDENRGVNVNVSVPQEYNAYYGDGAGF